MNIGQHILKLWSPNLCALSIKIPVLKGNWRTNRKTLPKFLKRKSALQEVLVATERETDRAVWVEPPNCYVIGCQTLQPPPMEQLPTVEFPTLRLLCIAAGWEDLLGRIGVWGVCAVLNPSSHLQMSQGAQNAFSSGTSLLTHFEG